MAKLAREHFPQLAIVARARNVTHYYELRNLGVEWVERETLESALLSARSVLERLGFQPHQARTLAWRFRRHNVALVEAMRGEVERFGWMSEPTRQTALAKLATFNPQLGYPDTWQDLSTVKVDRRSAFANLLAGRRLKVEADRRLVGHRHRPRRRQPRTWCRAPAQPTPAP
mgnify:CR=1 FL=1